MMAGHDCYLYTSSFVSRDRSSDSIGGRRGLISKECVSTEILPLILLSYKLIRMPCDARTIAILLLSA